MMLAINGLPLEYADKIYGGVLGKIIGVRLGIPVEFQKTSVELQTEYSCFDGYLREEDVTRPDDDDINGFVFLSRVFEQLGDPEQLTPEHVAETILNYAAENRGFFWWEDSAESAVFHHLLNGVSASECGSYENVGGYADMVGGQIFYDAIWLIFAGSPDEAARCADIVASVMHGDEGKYGARFLCACISAAFEKHDIPTLIETGLRYIPEESQYACMVRDIVRFHVKYPSDWRICQRYLDDRYDGHTIWDYGSHIIMALLYGCGVFKHSMEICLKSAGEVIQTAIVEILEPF